MTTLKLIDNMELSYYYSLVDHPVYEDGELNKILEVYRQFDRDTYIFFPKMEFAARE